MLTFLITLDVILALIIITSVFFHQGPDGFMGDATPTKSKQSGPVFEGFDKFIAVCVALFFGVTMTINYMHLYKDNGTASIDQILEHKSKAKIEAQKEKTIDVDAKHDAPLAQ